MHVSWPLKSALKKYAVTRKEIKSPYFDLVMMMNDQADAQGGAWSSLLFCSSTLTPH